MSDGLAAIDPTESLDLRLSRLPRNDVGNAERLRHRFGGDLMFVKGVGWAAWDGKRWSFDTGAAQAELVAQATVAAMHLETAAIETAGKFRRESAEAFKKRIASARDWQLQSGNAGRIKGLLGRAQPHLGVSVGALDQVPLLLNVANGTIELGPNVRLREHRRTDRITMISPVSYDPAAPTPLAFLQFLEAILPDPAIRDYLQRWFGYCATGLNREQVLTLLHGTGKNGKSTLMDIVCHVLGTYVTTLNIKSLLRDDRSNGSQATPDLAKLPGKRLVRTSEPDQGAQLAEGRIKEMTGGEPLSARNLNEGFFDFVPQFKLTVSFNNKPVIRGLDEGIWRRVLLVPFDVQIDRPDKTLPARLQAEASGILNWILDGAEKYLDESPLQGGLKIPDAVRAATNEYRAESDQVGEFLATAIEFNVPDGKVKGAQLYGHYCDWCKANGYEPMKGALFGRRVKGRPGIFAEKVGTIVYLCIALKRFQEEAA